MGDITILFLNVVSLMVKGVNNFTVYFTCVHIYIITLCPLNLSNDQDCREDFGLQIHKNSLKYSESLHSSRS